MICGVYAIRNAVNGKLYIGSSEHIKRRWALHRSQLKKNKHHSILLQRAWNKYGESAFEFIILELVDDLNNIFIVEQRYLDEYKPQYNMLPIAGATTGRTHSEKARQKMSAAKKGIAPMHATRAAVAVTTGIPRSQEVIDKIRASQRARWAAKRTELLANVQRNAKGQFDKS